MNARTFSDPGHTRFMGLHDHRVSHAEQQDHQIPAGEPAAWQVIALALSPLLVIAGVSLTCMALS